MNLDPPQIESRILTSARQRSIPHRLRPIVNAPGLRLVTYTAVAFKKVSAVCAHVKAERSSPA